MVPMLFLSELIVSTANGGCLLSSYYADTDDTIWQQA